MEPDFSGYATKNGLKCSDGRVIVEDAFKHNDGARVPLVWQHQHDTSGNVLGHAILENRSDGVYAYGYFNSTPAGTNAKALVQHGDITAMSIYANNLKQRGDDVIHGNIREVSLVMVGANPGAFIENVNLAHGDSYDTLNDEAFIYTGLSLEHADKSESVEKGEDKSDDEETIADIYSTMTEKQKNVVSLLVAEALEITEESDDDESDADADEKTEDVKHSDEATAETVNTSNDADENVDEQDLKDDAENGDIKHSQEGNAMTTNVFEQNGPAKKRATLTHSQIETIVDDAKKLGSFKESFLQHAGEYGIDNIEVLFPDAKLINQSPDLIARQTEWVAKVLAGTKHSPFSRIKSVLADLTAEEARAKGYIKGNMKKDEVISLLKRTTSPTTVYKKQKLDRDDILDITDLDVIVWLKAEIRLMLNEEIARAILVGDGRPSSSDDKIKDPAGTTDGVGIRSIANEHELYAHKVQLAANVGPEAMIEQITRARSKYRGSGNPSLYITDPVLTDMLLLKDKMGRRLYDTEASLATVLRVKEIVAVEVMEETPDLLAIIVNLVDYTIGADKGGELTFFEDFDIDFNQHKYLLETRISGALTRPKSAIVIRRDQGTSATPSAPSFDGATNTITVPTTTGIVYTVNGEPVTGEQVITADTTVEAVADAGYYIPANTTTEWTFTYTAG